MKYRSSLSARRLTRNAVLCLMLVLLTFTGTPLPVHAACQAQDTTRGTVSANFTIATAGSYRVWSRIMAPDSTNNSYILEIDGTTCGVVVGDSSSIPANTWTWVNYQSGNPASSISVSLTAGSHNLVAIGREDSVAIDRILFTPDTTCVPNGTGDNCLNGGSSGGTTSGGTTATGSTSSSGTGGSTVVVLGSGVDSTITVQASTNPITVAAGTDVVVAPAASASQVADITHVQYYLDGKLVATVTKAPFTYQVDTGKLSKGSHQLVSKVYYQDGTSKSTTQTLNVKNTAKHAASPTAGIGISLIIVAAIIGGLIIIQRKRGGLRWHGHTLVAAEARSPEEDYDVTAMIRSSNQPPDRRPLPNQAPAPGAIVEYHPDNGPPPPQSPTLS